MIAVRMAPDPLSALTPYPPLEGVCLDVDGADRAEEAARAAAGRHRRPGGEPRGEGPDPRPGPDQVLLGTPLQWVSRRPREPAHDHRPRARAPHHGGLAVPGPQGPQGMTAAGLGCQG